VNPKIETLKIRDTFRVVGEGEPELSQSRVFTKEFKVAVVERILNGESVSALHHELKIKRSILYRWRDAYRAEGEAGLSRPKGRPPGAVGARCPSAGKGAQAMSGGRASQLTSDDCEL
jgi:transposase-like protein